MGSGFDIWIGTCSDHISTEGTSQGNRYNSNPMDHALVYLHPLDQSEPLVPIGGSPNVLSG